MFFPMKIINVKNLSLFFKVGFQHMFYFLFVEKKNKIFKFLTFIIFIGKSIKNQKEKEAF